MLPLTSKSTVLRSPHTTLCKKVNYPFTDAWRCTLSKFHAHFLMEVAQWYILRALTFDTAASGDHTIYNVALPGIPVDGLEFSSLGSKLSITCLPTQPDFWCDTIWINTRSKKPHSVLSLTCARPGTEVRASLVQTCANWDIHHSHFTGRNNTCSKLRTLHFFPIVFFQLRRENITLSASQHKQRKSCCFASPS